MGTGTRQLYRKSLLLACIVLLLTAVACGKGSEEEGGKLVVVKEPKENTGSPAGVEPETINKFEGISGLDWLDDDRILAQTVSEDGETGNVRRADLKLWELDLRTGGRMPWNAGTGVVWLSPDRRYAFIAEPAGDRYTFTGKLADLSSGESRRVSLEAGILTGSWSDDGEFALAMGQGHIFLIDTGGRKHSVHNVQDPDGLLALQKSGDSLYMLNAAGKLQALALNGTSSSGETAPRTLLSGVTEFRVAPGGKQLAAVRGLGKTELHLQVYSPSGKAIGGEIARSSLVERLAWSPDGSKLAFSTYSIGQGMKGIYVFDTVSRRISLVSDLQGVSYPLRWNPSGNRLMLTVSGSGESPAVTTYIMKFR